MLDGPRMFFLLRPTFFGPMLVGLVIAAALTASHRLQERFDSARSRARDSCRAFRAAPGHEKADVCNDDAFAPPLWPRFREGRSEIAFARTNFERRDTAGAITALATALQIANELDDRATLTSSLLSARLVSDTLELLDAFDLDRGFRRTLLSGVHLRSARHPFEGERVDRLWMIARDDSWFSHTPFGQVVLVDDMVKNDIVLDAMDRALADNDVERCRLEAFREVGIFPSAGLDVSLCPTMVSVVSTARRLDETRGALAKADPW